jgi:Na+/melibiose symporter-like transporter
VDEKNYERFIRWQGVTREQLGATSNLLLGLATGLLAFATTLFLEKKFIASCAFGFGILAIILLVISIALALWCATNRIEDFRLTTKIANPENSKNPQLGDFREEAMHLGRQTWCIFRSQIWSFALGAGAISIGIIMQVFSQ